MHDSQSVTLGMLEISSNRRTAAGAVVGRVSTQDGNPAE
jgi:hypothetical protein